MIKESLLNARGLMALFLLTWALYIFYPFSFSDSGISADGVTYVHIAKNLILDGSPGWQATWTAPFFPVLVAVLYPVFDNFVIAATVVSKIMTAMLPLAVYLLTRDIFNSRVGIVAAILTALHPHFIFASGAFEPEPTYTTIQVFSLWAIWRAFKSSGQWSGASDQLTQNSKPETRNFLWGILGGVISSLAYQTRSEGMLTFVFAMLALLIISLNDQRQESGGRRLKGKRLIILSIITVSFILTSLPYLIFLKGTYGKWVLSPKSSYVQIWMKDRIYHDNDLGEQGNPELWGLSKNGKLMWQEPKGVGDLASYLMEKPARNLRIYLHNFTMQIPGRIPNNSGQWLYPQVYPWYFVIPALFWISVSLIKKDTAITSHPSSSILTDWGKTLFLLSPFAILFILPIVTEGWWKYLLPYSPFLVILAVAGISEICARFHWKQLLPALTIVIVCYSLWAVKASSLVKHGDRGVTMRVSMVEEQKKAGIWAQKKFKGTPNYMISWSKLAYYLNGRWTAMPVTTYDRMVWYARKNRVDYIVFETSGKYESDEIVRVMGNTVDLEVAGLYESPTTGYNIVFLRLK